MLVRVQSNGRKILGLELRGTDVHRYFPEHTPFVELQLGELRIDCQLKPEFWRHEPLIADYRLSAWLEAKVVHGRACRVAPSLELTPCGKNSFALSPPGGCEIAKCMQPPAVAESCIAGRASGAARNLHSQQTGLPPKIAPVSVAVTPAARKERRGGSDENHRFKEGSRDARCQGTQGRPRAGTGSADPADQAGALFFGT